MHVIQKFFGPNYFFWSALKVPPSDFIQNMSQAPSKCLRQQIDVDELDYFKTYHSILKILFWGVLMNIYKVLQAKLESANSFTLKYSKITVCRRDEYCLKFVKPFTMSLRKKVNSYLLKKIICSVFTISTFL